MSSSCVPKGLTETERLQLREGQLRGILATASEGIVTVDEAQTIVMANAMAAAIFGRSVDALIGSPLATLIPARYRDAHAGAVAAFAASDAPARPMGGRDAMVGLRANGEEFPIEAGISVAHADGTRLCTIILRDLSEPRRTAGALRGSEELLAATFRVSNVGMAQIDPTTHRFLAANEAFCQLCGYAEAELQALTVDRLSRPEDPGCIVGLDRLVADRVPFEAERRLVRKDGSSVWVQVSSSLALDDAGRPGRLVCVAQDITSRRSAETALRAREARQSFLVRLNDRLRQLSDPDMIGHEAAFLLGEFAGTDGVGYAEDDGDGISITVTRRGERAVSGAEGRRRYQDYGLTLMDALRAGRTVVRPDVAHDPTLTAAEKAAHAALQLGATVNVPLLRGTRLLAVFFVHSRRAREWTPDEVALFEDVAERIRAGIERARAEASVRAAKAKLEAALSSMNDAVFMSDTDGMVTDFNEAFLAFHRFKDRAASPRDLREFETLFEVTGPDGEAAPATQWAIPRALRGETGSNVEYGLRDKRSGERWVGSYSFAPVRDAEGRIVGSVCSARDITEMKRIRSELEASQGQLRRLIAAQDSVQEQERMRIARELHDDLQQSLAAILMEAQVVRSSAGGVDGRVRVALDRIEQIGGDVIASLRRIVHDLRPQALEELGLVAALQSLVAGFAERSGIVCRVDTSALDGDDPDRIAPVATCLYRVAQEALNNVARHSRARHVDLRLSRHGDGSVALGVTDDGLGVRDEDLAKPESFGLLGMRERVRTFGGTLSVQRGPQGGTTVVATLPLPR